jgi:hypothetical protein
MVFPVLVDSFLQELKDVRKYTDGLEKEVDLMAALLQATEDKANEKVRGKTKPLICGLEL